MSEQAGSPRRRRIVFLFSDTGGGHRSATEAMIEALDLEYPGVFDPRMADSSREYYPPPLTRPPELSPPISKLPQAWGLGFRSSNSRGRADVINALSYPYLRKAV